MVCGNFILYLGCLAVYSKSNRVALNIIICRESKLPPWRIFASFLFVKKGRARPGPRGKPCASRNSVRGHSLKITLSYQDKKEKFHPGIRVIPVPAEFPYEATHTKRKEEAFAVRQRFFFSLSSAPGVLHSHQDYL